MLERREHWGVTDGRSRLFYPRHSCEGLALATVDSMLRNPFKNYKIEMLVVIWELCEVLN